MTAPNGNNYGGYNQQPPQYNQQYYSQPQQSGGVGGATIAAIYRLIELDRKVFTLENLTSYFAATKN